MKKVFLGGTCNGSKWREELISMLKIDYFNPVVDDWNEECQAEEIRQRNECDYCLYVITPKMTGSYAIAEVVDDSNKRPEKTVFCYIDNDEDMFFNKAQKKSLAQVGLMIVGNGGHFCDSIKNVASYLNEKGNNGN